MRTSSRPTLLKRVALVTGAMLVLPASAALADEHVDEETAAICYEDPTNEVCVETGVLDGSEDVDETVVDSEVEEVDDETVAAPTSALADTGADVAVLGLLAALLLGGGILTIVTSRRRTVGSTSS